VHAVYDELPDVLADLGLDAVDAVLFDLGVSSMQLDVASAASPTPRTRRSTCGWTARPADRRRRPQHLPAAELTRVLRSTARRGSPARSPPRWCASGRKAPFTTSARLVELLYAEIPAPARRTGGHPAKRTFQALRMEVNDELAVLRRAIPAAIDAIGVGGRVVVEAYHSLEDRLVKQSLHRRHRGDVPEDLRSCPRATSRPCGLVTRGSVKADAAEIEQNPRAASVRLRAIERIHPTDSRGVAR
jgi:16S rRNA (cytosine1402-N4)-methyltransferase